MAKSQAEVLQEIARLQGAIDRARQPAPSYRGGRGYRGRGGPAPRARGTSQHRTLILNKPTSAATPSLPLAPKTAALPQTPAQSTSTASKEIVIDGVAFISDPRGNKLIRKGEVNATTDGDKPAAISTPTRASVAGQTYVRTKNGNLISLALVNKRAADEKFNRVNALVGAAVGAHNANKRVRTSPSKPSPRKRSEPCRFFTSTGQCRSGLTCPYAHDPDKIAICPRYLRNACPLGESCPLSHSADGHRMPHCLHFPDCKHGTSCRYPHVHVGARAGICRPFATLGYCERGLTCPERHVRECPEFSEKSTCSTKGCRLPHIIRKRPAESTLAEAAVAVDDDVSDEEQKLPTSGEEDAVVNLLVRKRDGSSSSPSKAIKVKKRPRLGDGVADQQDFVTFSFDDDETMTEEEEELEDVDSDVVDSNDDT